MSEAAQKGQLGRSKCAASVAQWVTRCHGMPAAWVQVPSLTILLFFLRIFSDNI